MLDVDVQGLVPAEVDTDESVVALVAGEPLDSLGQLVFLVGRFYMILAVVAREHGFVRRFGAVGLEFEVPLKNLATVHTRDDNADGHGFVEPVGDGESLHAVGTAVIVSVLLTGGRRSRIGT